jgi:catalase
LGRSPENFWTRPRFSPKGLPTCSKPHCSTLLNTDLWIHQDLIEAIENRCYPTWKFGIQVISEADQDKFEFDILDATKLWPEDMVPVRYIGKLCLNRNVEEFFSETEQVAFCTSHVVPGIGFSDDPLLQGRNFSYFGELRDIST